MANRYKTLVESVFEVFGSPEWLGKDIKTVPQAYTLKDHIDEYIRISIVPSGSSVNLNSVSGLLLIDIFVVNNLGPIRYSEIADDLDLFLVGKSFVHADGNVSQFQASTCDRGRTDTANPLWFRVEYTIPFSHYGVN